MWVCSKPFCFHFWSSLSSEWKYTNTRPTANFERLSEEVQEWHLMENIYYLCHFKMHLHQKRLVSSEQSDYGVGLCTIKKASQRRGKICQTVSGDFRISVGRKLETKWRSKVTKGIKGIRYRRCVITLTVVADVREESGCHYGPD